MPNRDNNFKNEELWVTKDGEAIPVGELNEHHCRNTLRMLIKQIRTGNLVCLGGHQERLNIARGMEEI